MKKSFLYLLITSCICACSSGASYQETENTQNKIAKVDPLIFQNSTYSTNYFDVTVNGNWYVTSNEGPSMPAHITLTHKKDNSIITISIAKYFRTMQETCDLSAKNLVNDRQNLKKGPVFENNTCVIKAHENGKDMGMFLRVYNDNSFYSIHYEGNEATVTPVIKSIHGDSRMQSMIDSIK